jgi:serine/threonine protein kinase
MPPLFPLANGQTYTVAGKYEATHILGEGRFSVVYHAYDRRNARDVALKAYFSASDDSWQRSKAEEKTLKSVSTLNSPFFPKLIQSIKTLVEHTNHPVLVLELGEYVDPSLPPKSIVTLKAVLDGLKAGPPQAAHAVLWQPDTLRDFCLDLCQAVAELHSIGVIHRDIKPTNVLLKRAAGSSRIYPFILDFNAVGEASSEPAGTRNYLPPEVTAGPRGAPAAADDLWAVARLIWELFHGEGTAPGPSSKPHPLISSPPPARAVEVLRKALSTNPADRYPDVGTLREHLETAFSTPVAARPTTALNEPKPAPAAAPTRSDFHAARAAEERIRDSIIYTLETGDAPPVPKEIRELVALALETSADGSSTAIDLRSDLISLGPKAFPAILEQSYKLRSGTPEWLLSSQALVELARNGDQLAAKSLRYYCTSSSYAVRSMCVDVCAALRLVPDELLDLLANDDGLLGTAERQRLLDHIFEHASESAVFFSLISYMCNALMVDERKYVPLRDGIALRLHSLPGDDQAEAIFGDAQRRVWQDSRAYQAKSPNILYAADIAALRLLGDAFAALPDAVAVLEKRHPETFANRQAEPWSRTVWLEFLKKCVARDATLANRMRELARRSGDAELPQEIDRLLTRQNLQADEIPLAFDQYIRGEVDSREIYNALRFDRTGLVAKMVNDTLCEGVTTEELERALTLLKGFQSRARNSVVKCVLAHWPLLKGHDLERTCSVLTQADIRDNALRTRVAHMLDEELRESGSEIVRNALNQILASS